MPKPSREPDFDHLETPVMQPLPLRFDPASRQYHRDPIAASDEPAEREGAQRA